jgi:hypothetical protein
MRKNILNIGCCILAFSIGSTQQIVAQEGIEIRDLQINSSLINAKKTPLKKSTTPLLLPFFDDFSSLHSPYPNPELWQDNTVFINTSFPIFPPTVGVATFDALDANGRLYRHATSDQPYFSADTLTSQPIRMDSIFSPIPRQLTPSDSIYLSVYYQPGGGLGNEWRGRAPRTNDLLILEFRNGDQWVEVWSSNGQTLEEFCPLCATDTAENLKTYFKQEMIPITAESYFYENFQFRFRNLSSLYKDQNNSRPHSGGQWHLDYVRLAHNRSINDVFSSDIAFVDQAKRVLKDFQAMPAKQFQGAADLVSQIPLVFRNLDLTPQVAEYQYRIFDQSGQVVWNMIPSNANIYPFHSRGFNSDPDLSKPQLVYQFPNVTNPQTYTIQHTLKRTGSQDICASNDTMVQTVHFGNFYAYDDGTPEAGIGFSRERDRLTSQFAYQFPLRVPDTLVAIQIWFNPTLEDMRRASLNLAVWTAENNSTPSQQPIFAGKEFPPIYNETIGYQIYVLESPVALKDTLFFIGFQQQNDVFLNIGFDQNNNAENRMFYNLNGNEWLPLLNYGSIMMRPIFGTPTPTGFCERGVVAEQISIYSNPSDGMIFVESPENVVIGYEIYDLNGRKLFQQTCRSTQFSITLPERSGFYILVLNTEKGLVSKKVVRR